METPHFAPWSGAWPEAVLFSFLALTGEESIKATEAASPPLLSELADPAKARLKRVSELLARVRAHDGHARLKRFAGFAVVMAERQRLAKGNALFSEPFGEMRLEREIALIIGTYDPSFIPKRATLAHQRKVYKVTQELRGLLMPGAEPVDVFEMSDLRRLLKKLADDLDAAICAADRNRQRPARADKNAAQRYWVGGFCKRLVESFGVAPPVIVGEVAIMIGFTPDESTIARYIARAGSGRR